MLALLASCVTAVVFILCNCQVGGIDLGIFDEKLGSNLRRVSIRKKIQDYRNKIKIILSQATVIFIQNNFLDFYMYIIIFFYFFK